MNNDGTPGAVLWCLRYVNPETGRERTETFRLKRDAERRLTEIEASKLTGSYVDPRAGKVTVAVWAERWLEVQVQLKATTQARYRSILDVHVIPRWGQVEVAKVRHSDVQKWVADLSSERSPATVRKIHRVLSQVLGSAVKDAHLPTCSIRRGIRGGRSRRSHSACAPAHRGLAGDRRRGRRQGRSADARTQVGHNDARPVRASVSRPSRHRC